MTPVSDACRQLAWAGSYEPCISHYVALTGRVHRVEDIIACFRQAFHVCAQQAALG